ncbi:MAG: [protein-PII] uridylyltransferase [Acidimicrobiia bacterium]|nr:[protein-PII] uridylyltransferase [Acidimicrobiia bacterium]
MSNVRLRRDEIIDNLTLRGRELCRAHSAILDQWLGALFRDVVHDGAGIALVAVGGYGRGELSPGSDIDVLLLHTPKYPVDEVAEKLWYPVWDEGLKLGHSVRTPKQALDLAGDDLETATALLHCRLVAGDRALAKSVADDAREQWRAGANRYLAELADRTRERHHQMGEVAFLLEPDLKNARGGLRDVHALRWAEVAEPVLVDESRLTLDKPYGVLVAARAEVHRLGGPVTNILRLDRQDDVASRLGYADADALMADVAGAGRSIAWTSDATWHRIRRSRRGRRLRTPKPREVLPGVILEDRMIRVDRRTGIASDPLVLLRLAVAAATHQAFIERATLERLAEEAPVLPDPWPDEARGLLADLLLTGDHAIPVIEALDQMGLFVRILPEWEPCRSRPQRNAYHTFTVDRHLCEAAAQAAALADEVDRPDLLVLGALFHDIGKGYPGDHTEVGMVLVDAIAHRMGFDDDEVDLLVDMVKHHLLLPDVATRRDLDDDRTIRSVAEQVRTVDTLELLAALTEADSIATGPAAWSEWKAGLVNDLVERTAHVLRGGDPTEVVDNEFPTSAQRELLASGTRHIEGHGDTLTIVSQDRPGLFNRVAGVLALNGVDVFSAAAYSEAGMGLEVYRVASAHGAEPAWDRILADVDRAIDAKVAIDARLVEREQTYGHRSPATARPMSPRIVFDNDASAVATVVEVSCPDRMGVLYRITKVLHEFDFDIVSAKVQTLMHDVVDTFYVRDRNGDKVTELELLAELERGLLHALAT